MDLEQSIALFLDHRRDKQLSPESLDLYRYWFDLWQSWRAKQNLAPNLAAIGVDELRAFFRYLEREHVPHSSNPRRPAAKRYGLAAASRDSCWRTLRALWNFLADEGHLQPAQVGLFKRDRVPRPHLDVEEKEAEDEQPDRAVDATTVSALLEAIGAPFTEVVARNRAIILMLYDSGLRVSELCRLNDRNVDLAERTAKVRGKGGRKRFVFWGKDTDQALKRYLALRDTTIGPLFRGVSSRNKGGRLTRDAVRGMIKRLAASAGIDLPPFAPVHGFRSGFAQRMLDEGVDGLDLQQLLGHRDIRTTMIYVTRHPRKLRAVHRRATDRGATRAAQGRTRSRIS